MRQLRHAVNGAVPLAGDSIPWTPPDWRPSQINPNLQWGKQMRDGRGMRGLGYPAVGALDEDVETADDSVPYIDVDPALAKANELDDCVGNGIFDSEITPPVQHAGGGIFETGYAEPGYLYRERMTYPSEVRDAKTGGQMMFRPGGGAWPVDMADTFRPYDQEVARMHMTGPQWSRPRAPLAPTAGFGAVEGGSTATVATWAIGGLIIGIAAGMFWRARTAKR
jgi:hypothetical protein